MNPNIIVFFTDQQRWDTCGCYGQSLNTTPNLDKLAAEGVLFERAFTCQPVCGPARSCLQTGRYATQTGCYRNDIALPADQKTIAHHLKENGYRTGYIGKWHLASDTENGLDNQTKPIPEELRGGWEDWLASDILEFTSQGYGGYMFDSDGSQKNWPDDCYRVDALTDFALEHLDDYLAGEAPFILFISYIEPHHQNNMNRYIGPHGSKERFADFKTPGDLTEGFGDWEENYPDYLGAINALDCSLGRIRERVEEHNAFDDTLFLFFSDHGSHFKTRNNEYKRSCHEGSIHIPLVISGPGFRGGIRYENLVGLIDIPPTIIRASGKEPPSFMSGRPLQDEVSGILPARESIFIQISEDHIGRAVRTDKWKYEICAATDEPYSGWRFPSWDVYRECRLYDLESDPWERVNLIDDPTLKDVRLHLRSELLNHMEKAGERRPRAVLEAASPDIDPELMNSVL